jgi:hypothetical protein
MALTMAKPLSDSRSLEDANAKGLMIHIQPCLGRPVEPIIHAVQYTAEHMVNLQSLTV